MMMMVMVIPTLGLYDRRAHPRNHQPADALPIRRLSRASDEGSGGHAVEEGVVEGGGGWEAEEVEKVFDGDAVVGCGERFGRMLESPAEGYGTCGEKMGKTAPAPASAAQAIRGSCDDGKETGEGENKPGKLSTGEKRPQLLLLLSQ
ncbi:hypothetical protein HK104_004648 [Borealophlyctis nickersoniae]|nr:hypothetical protein HK104_004648 [Borealophlyctis nickersoniae]